MTRHRYKVIKNSAACALCGEILESKHVHDFQRCLCGAIFIDGGKDYIRWGGEPQNFIDMSVVEEYD